MLKYLKSYILLLLILIFLGNCTSKKKLVYFQGDLATNNSNSPKNYSPIFRTDDLLSITVSGMDLEAARPFNLPITNINNNLGGYTQGTPPPPGYLIDQNGNIDFPVLGKLKLAGLDRDSVVSLLKSKIQTYLSSPIVQIRILNYKVTVLGEVKNPGTFTIPNERITLPEALGLAGDLSINGIRKDIIIIRDLDGKKTEYKVDLTSKNLFNSPAYYLNQNDLVYVQPNRAKINSSVINPANAGIIISAISLLISVLVLVTR